jgi:hypothetical protein
MEKEEQRFVGKYFWMKDWGSQKIHKKLCVALGDDVSRLSQIKTWLQKFRRDDLSKKNLSRIGHYPWLCGRSLQHFSKSFLLPEPR